MPLRRVRIEVRGTVQGVGFRPFVVGLASRLGLAGDVANLGGRVVIDVQGAPSTVAAFLEELPRGAPAAAEVVEIRQGEAAPRDVAGFSVRASAAEAGAAFVAPDRGPCDACAQEQSEPASRRFGYPFGTCNACGPRWTTIVGAPYERARTTMVDFPPCAACERERDDPKGRYFLAETIACPACGPTLRWEGRGEGADPIAQAVLALRGGAVVAVKGVGGYHLACDAAHAGAVARLRAGKTRDAKPFAVLVVDEEAAARLADLDDAEREALRGPARPIVLVRRRGAGADGGDAIAAEVAPGTPWLGLLLPPSLLHLALARGAGRPLVLTSGNRADEPMPIDEEVARARLAGLADGFLHHDRRIVQRVDDSVVRVVGRRPVLLRRARGFAPATIQLPVPVPEPVLALGGDLKAAFAIAVGDRAMVSHHLGDLSDVATCADLARSIDHAERLLGVRPRVIAHDLHPDQESTRLAAALAASRGGRAAAVAHHHAHVAACLADAGHRGPVIGFAFDGLGLGADGGLWGGEVLVGDGARLERAAHLRAVALPGGDAAQRAPWRVALAHLVDAGLPLDRLATHASLPDRAFVEKLVRTPGGSPKASSMGRLFDAVACLAGLRGVCSFEGQAAIELEGAACASDAQGAYRFDVGDLSGAVHAGRWCPAGPPAEIDSRPVVRAALADLAAGADAGAVARRFHRAIADAVREVAEGVRAAGGPHTVALGGGVFANAVLLDACEAALSARGFEVLRLRHVPPNDGCLALGQIHVLAARAAIA